MKRTVLASIVLCFGIGCIPAQVTRNSAGFLAYGTEQGISVNHPDGTLLLTIPLSDEDGKACWVQWAPDDRRLAFTRVLEKGVQTLSVLSIVSGEVRELVRHTGQIYFPRWRPGSDLLAYVLLPKDGERSDDRFDSELRLVPTAGGESRVVARGSGILADFSPDGKTIATVTTARRSFRRGEPAVGSLSLVEVDTGKVTLLVSVLFDPYSHVRFSPDGRSVFFAVPCQDIPARRSGKDRPSSGLFRYDIEKEHLSRIGPAKESITLSLASPSGGRMLYISAEQNEVLEGKVFVTGEGIEDRVDLGKCSGKLLPFWVDENRVALHTGTRIQVHDVGKGTTEDYSDRLSGLSLTGHK